MLPRTKEHIARMIKKSGEHFWDIWSRKKQKEKDERCSQFLPEGIKYVKEKEK